MQQPDKNTRGFKEYAFIIGAAAFVTTIAQMEIIGQLPIRYMLYKHLNVKPEQMSLFLLISGLAWYIKPIAGIITDSVPLFGTRHRHYLMLSAAGAGFCWLLMGIVPEAYYPVLLTALVLNAMIVVASTVMGALLVEKAQDFGATGRLSSLREGMNALAAAIGLPAGGYLAGVAFYWTGVSAAGLLFALTAIVYFFLREKPPTEPTSGVWEEAATQLSQLLRQRTLLTACALLFLFYMAPGIGTPLYYLQTDTLKFSQQFIGWQAVISSATGMIGAFIYARICQKVSLRPLLYIGITLSAVSTMLYMDYHSRDTAIMIVAINGLLATIGVLPLFDLATRATPKGSEGLGFALMMSLRNFALFSADWIGSWLMQSHHWPFSRLVILNAATTFIVIFAIPFLPYELLRATDSDGAKEVIRADYPTEEKNHVSEDSTTSR